jgi:hypothetical protein
MAEKGSALSACRGDVCNHARSKSSQFVYGGRGVDRSGIQELEGHVDGVSVKIRAKLLHYARHTDPFRDRACSREEPQPMFSGPMNGPAFTLSTVCRYPHA